jgi:hypothetical protein
MPSSKPRTSRKKPQTGADPVKQVEPPRQPAAEWADTDGLSGHGAESALAHLKERENRRVDKSDKDKR